MRIGGSARRVGKEGFTLLEMVAVMAVCGCLAMAALPLWATSMAEARARLCAGNLGQVGRAVAMYASEHEERLPGNQHSPPSWVVSLGKYANTNAYRCPDEMVGEGRGFTIALNDYLTPRPYGARQMNFAKRTVIPVPEETLMFAEADESYRAYDHFHFADAKENGHSAEAFSEQVDVERHGRRAGGGRGIEGGANYLFADGRVEELRWDSAVKPKLRAKGSRLVDPTGGMGGVEMAER
jgi:prepilin-type N-terminal cleavage/methylation domain-containing protein/prepilin-type processing-associated H-X9-DG protein